MDGDIFQHPHLPYMLLKAAMIENGGMLNISAESIDSPLMDGSVISMEWREDTNTAILTLQEE